jgi:hypothetical protein
LKVDLQALHYFWARQSSWMRWWLAMAVALASCAAVFAWQRVVAARHAAVESELSGSGSGLVAAAASSAQGALAAPENWVNQLPRSVPAMHVVQAFQNASREAGVALVSLQLREEPPTEAKLGRVELALMLRGPYGAVKRALGGALSLFPSATVRSMQWRATGDIALSGAPVSIRPGMPGTGQRGQAAASSSTELNVVVSVWTAPQGMGLPEPDQAN